jgi:indolepyruvate ferredoxin oxidoreductase
MQPALRLLARMRPLRGTVIDPFRFGADRRLDADLLRWYEAAMDHVASRHNAGTDPDCRTILSAPMDIRGYGPVREASAQWVRASVDPLLQKPGKTAPR